MHFNVSNVTFQNSKEHNVLIFFPFIDVSCEEQSRNVYYSSLHLPCFQDIVPFKTTKPNDNSSKLLDPSPIQLWTKTSTPGHKQTSQSCIPAWGSQGKATLTLQQQETTALQIPSWTRTGQIVFVTFHHHMNTFPIKKHFIHLSLRSIPYYFKSQLCMILVISSNSCLG